MVGTRRCSSVDSTVNQRFVCAVSVWAPTLNMIGSSFFYHAQGSIVVTLSKLVVRESRVCFF